MGSTMVRLALGGLLLAGGLAWGQGGPQAQTTAPTTKPKQALNLATKQAFPSLDEMLAKSLKNNPDIRVAEAKLREAEANLNQARLQVAQKVVQLHQDLETARASVKAAEANAQRVLALSRRGVTPQNDLDKAQTDLIAAKAKLASLEAQVPYLMGSPPPNTRGVALADYDRSGRLAVLSGPVDQNGRLADVTLALPTVRDDVRAAPAGNLAEQIRKALDAPAGCEFQNAPLGQVLQPIGEKHGFSFVFRERLDDMPITLRVAPKTPLGALLEAIEDVTSVRFLVRDYGILVVPNDSVPLGTVSLRAFWKQPATKRVGAAIGSVTAADPKNGLVTINVGSDAGLKRGQQLQVYRLKPKPEYVGRILVLDARSHEAVGRGIQPMQVAPVVGDQVSRDSPVKK